MRSLHPAPRAVGERRCVAGNGERPEQVGVQDQRRGPRAIGSPRVQDSEGGDEQQILLQRRLTLLDDQPVRGFQHHLARGVGGIVVGQWLPKGVQRLHLGYHVQRAAGGELQVDVGKRFQSGAELRRRTPHSLGDRAHLAMPSAQHRDDPVGFAQFVGAQHDRIIAISRHLDIVPDMPRNSRSAARRMEARPPPRSPTPHASGARPPQVPVDRLPAHVAIVMDGNGRWAKARNLPRTEGHARGEESLFDVIEGAIEIGVKYLSAYAFSTENWSRSPDEVRWLMGFNRDVIRRRRDQLDAMGVRVRWAGRRPRLWRSVINELVDAEQRTLDNDVLTLQFCVNYGGRAEIVDATRRIAELAAAGRLDPRKLTEERFRHFLDEPAIPDVDLFIRSSGEQRTSNFLLWQSAYAELVFLDRLWPDFDRRDLWRAIEVYADRDRRYGGAIPNAAT